MASNTITTVLAPVKGESITDRKARLDAAFHAGSKADRTALMSHNGLRALREERGYGRAAVAKALGITAAEWWVAEFVFVPNSTEFKAMATKVRALPDLKVKADKKAKDTSSKKTSGKVDAADVL